MFKLHCTYLQSNEAFKHHDFNFEPRREFVLEKRKDILKDF